MAHIVTLKSSPTDPGVVYLQTMPDMAQLMGGFGPARYVGSNPPVPGVSYVVGLDDVPRFQVYCTNRSIHVVDQRDSAKPASQRPAWAESPLPECRQCGQPAKRGARLSFCPNCGATWDATEVGPAAQGRNQSQPMVVCDSCQRHTPQGFTHCCECGAWLAGADAPAPSQPDG